jgi:integrase
MLLDKWLEMVEPDLSPTTVTGYRRNIRAHVRPALGDMQLRKLEPADLDAFYAALRTQKGLAPATVRQVHAVIRRALRQGVIWKWLPSNPAALASPGRMDAEEHTPPLPAAVLRLIDAGTDSRSPDLGMFLRLAAATGARRGELCALRWSNLAGDELRIERAVIELADGSTVERSTKTKKPRRVRLDPETVEALEAHRAAWAARLALLGEKLGPDAHMFSTAADASTAMRPATMTQAFRRVRARAGVGGRLHDLRHFHATQLLSEGTPVKTVSARLGHANASTTLRIYAHALEADDQAAAATIGRTLSRDAKKPAPPEG